MLSPHLDSSSKQQWEKDDDKFFESKEIWVDYSQESVCWTSRGSCKTRWVSAKTWLGFGKTAAQQDEMVNQVGQALT